MVALTVYVFDTSAFIEAWVRAYPPDVFPRLWEHMHRLSDDGRLIAPEEVLTELEKRDDDLRGWVKARDDKIVVRTSREIMIEVRTILAEHEHLTKTGTGRSAADPFVIALAGLRGCPLVTQERGGTADKPRIPYVCELRNVACMTVLEVIRAEGWTF
jgi:Domain of unknown function (DUF4411)